VSSYQVIARKYRPQRFEDVIGQRGVTQTLRNAISAGRVAQSFVFSGPRGVGKTTTARILARALNCVNGPTPDPCGECEACLEIAQGRDIDVLEIDAATNTQVDKVRDVIIAGLGVAPVRNRYKIFIIDEVHRLSPQAFDALLKSIEEPPPHVVFMMATTEIGKVPATIQSRSQVFELRTIGVRQIAAQLRQIADAEGIAVDDAALMLVARAGDGSMRDAQSALDQVIAFAGRTLTAEDVSAVLGLVRRDLLFEMAEAVAAEDGAAALAAAGHAVESGQDLRLVIRELARLMRDLLVVRIDPARLQDPEIAAEGERDRLQALAGRYSAEDLMRGFDVLTKAEQDIRASMEPRYHVEMALLHLIHLRRLVPLAELIPGLEASGGATPRASAASARPAVSSSPRVAAAAPSRAAVSEPSRGAVPVRTGNAATVRAVEARREAARPAPAASPAGETPAPPGPMITDPVALKDAFFADVRQSKKVLYNTVFAQAQKVDVSGDRITFTFGPRQRLLRDQLLQMRPQLEERAAALAGRRIAIAAVEAEVQAESAAPAAAAQDRQAELRQRALADERVQAMLDVFGTEIKDVEEREPGRDER
jgi:DNA polymerase-3 subunit gamma/tau